MMKKSKALLPTPKNAGLLPVNNDEDKEVLALKEWINALISPPGMDIENPMEIGHLLEKTADANNKLKEILMQVNKLPAKLTTPQKMNSASQTLDRTPQKSRMILAADNLAKEDLEILRQNDLMDAWRKRAEEIHSSSEVPAKIIDLVNSEKVLIRKGVIISHIGLQLDLLIVLLSFHPIWLRLALETVFKVRLVFPTTAGSLRFVPTISNFVSNNLFKDNLVVKQSKGRVITPEGIHLLHKNFLSKLCQILFLVENMVLQAVVPNLPCMFVKNSTYKSIQDIFGFLSRDVISGTTHLPKMLARIGFEPEYKQGFFEEYEYRVCNLFVDLSDGIILAKLVEVLSARDGMNLQSSHGDLLKQLRNPQGDRIRRLNNLRLVLSEAVRRFPSKIKQGDTKAEDILAGKREAVVGFLMRLADVQENGASIEIQRFIRLVLQRRQLSRPTVLSSVIEQRKMIEQEKVRVAVALQTSIRGFLAHREFDRFRVAKAEELRLRREQATINIQCFLRWSIARNGMKSRAFAVTAVQTFALGWLAHREHVRIRGIQEEEEKERIKRRNNAAIELQASIRGFLARRDFDRFRVAKAEELSLRREQATINIQTFALGWLAHRQHVRLWKSQEEEKRIKRQHNAATKLQTSIRGFLAHRDFDRFRVAKEEELRLRREQATIDIQCFLRWSIARNGMKSRAFAVTAVQAFARGWLAHREHLRIRRIQEEEEKERITRRNNAAIELQRLYSTIVRRKEMELAALMIRYDVSEIVKIQKFIRNWLHEKRVQASVVVQSLARAYLAGLLHEEMGQSHSDALLEGVVSESLSRRCLCANRLSAVTNGSRKFSDYVLRRNGLELILDAMLSTIRSEAHLSFLRPISQAILNILKYSSFSRHAVERDNFKELIRNSVRQIHNNYKDALVVVPHSQILELLKDDAGFKDTLIEIQYPWYYEQFSKHFHRLPETDARYGAYQILKKLFD